MKNTYTNKYNYVVNILTLFILGGGTIRGGFFTITFKVLEIFTPNFMTFNIFLLPRLRSKKTFQKKISGRKSELIVKHGKKKFIFLFF